MSNQNLTVEESFEIIEKMIQKRKQAYEENGLVIMVWGLLVMFAGCFQYFMIANGQAEKSGLIWLFTMVPGFIITFVAKMREGRKEQAKTKQKDYTGLIWMVAGMMALFTGFVFGEKFGIAFTAALYFPFCIAGVATWLRLREFGLVLLSVLAIIFAYSSLFVEFRYHPLIAAAIALVLMFIPGLKLYLDFKKKQNV